MSRRLASLPIDLDDVHRAAERLDGVARRTPVLTSRTLDERAGTTVALKAETFQRGGAFKFRGAYNAISSLPAASRARGVCAVSSGNHAQAVAIAAGLCDVRATILMPADAPALKRVATEGYGASVIEFDRYADDRDALVIELARERGLELVHPYDNRFVMAGQGTVALELVAQVDALDVLLVPVGGGGLISGCATVFAATSPGTRVIGVEPAASDDTARSMRSGRRERVAVGATIADGQQAAIPGELTWPVVHELVAAVVTVDDDQVREAMRFCFERCKLVVEPSGATALAALLCGVVPCDGQRVGVVLSGGNVGVAGFMGIMGG
ncbi:MAG: pyridoxal-phosphate dependent enzyme [Solirubrobacterales bacterium]|nr:pyridoxal-phosphate dependent enzyme [Solirubrobacterales bacterium]